MIKYLNYFVKIILELNLKKKITSNQNFLTFYLHSNKYCQHMNLSHNGVQCILCDIYKQDHLNLKNKIPKNKNSYTLE